MAFRICILLLAVASAHSAYLSSPYGAYAPHGYASPEAYAPTVTSQDSNILRSYGNLGQVSTHSKTIDTPFSSVSKADVRVSNPGYATSVGYGGYGGYGGYAAPLGYAGAAVAPGLLGVAYSAAPAVAHMTYANALGVNYAW